LKGRFVRRSTHPDLADRLADAARRVLCSKQIGGGKMTPHLSRIAVAAAFVLVQASLAAAAELKVFSTIGVQSALEQLTPQLAKASGATLAVTWGTAAMLTKRVEAGETADVLILTREGVDTLAKEGKVAPGSTASFASSAIALSVKAGAPKPDISTPDAFKKALLAAKTVAYSDPAAGGASGVYFAKLLERMGIAEEMKAKTRHPPPGGNSANLLLTGEVEFAVQQKPEVMSVAGTEVVGLLPPELNTVTVYAAGVGAGSAQADAARALIAVLRSPEAAAIYKAKGLDPG
jgi:molybdate transport system substrate-binding protein